MSVCSGCGAVTSVLTDGRCTDCWDDFWGEVPVEPVTMPKVVTEIDQLRAENESLRVKVDGLKTELDNMYPALTAAEQKNAWYAHELDLMRKDAPAFEDRIDDLHRELNEVRDELQSVADELHDARELNAEIGPRITAGEDGAA